MFVFPLSSFRQIAAIQPKVAAIQGFAAASLGKALSRKSSPLFAQGSSRPVDEISAAMSTPSAAKKDSFAADESIHGSRQGYAETELIRIAASYQDFASPIAKIAAKERKIAVSNPLIEARKELPERPLRYGGASDLHLAAEKVNVAAS